MTFHKQISIPLGGKLVNIDEEIAGLVANLYHLGIPMMQSCQDGGGCPCNNKRWMPGFVQFVFEDPALGMRFVKLIANSNLISKDILERMKQWPGAFNTSHFPVPVGDHNWRYSIKPLYGTGFDFGMWVYFPREDLDTVNKIISFTLFAS